MFSKSYEDGMKSGAKPFEEKFKKQEENFKDIGREVDKKVDHINNIMDDIIDDLSSKEKKELYDLNTVVDIAKIDDTEKEVLVSVLYTLANLFKNITEQQQSYIRAVQKYLHINYGQIIELSRIENVDSITSQKAILQTVMEFLFLENGNHEYFEKYAGLFDYFNLKQKDFNEIKNAIDVIFRATGLKGISEKYGFVVDNENIDNCPIYHGDDISEKCADRVNINEYVVLDKYLVYEQNGYFKVNKENGSELQIVKGIESYVMCGSHNKLFLFRENDAFIMIDVDTQEKRNIGILGNWSNLTECKCVPQCSKDYLIYKSEITDVQRLVIYDINTGESRILENLVNGENVLTCSNFQLVNEKIYFEPQHRMFNKDKYPISNDNKLKDKLYVFNIETNELDEVCNLPPFPYFLNHGIINQFGNILYTYDTNENNGYCTYLDLNDPKGIKTIVLPHHDIDTHKKFVAYDCCLYVTDDKTMAIGKYNIITGEDNIILKATQCSLQTPQVVGKWLYYRGQTSKKIRKSSIDNVEGSSVEVDTDLYHDYLDFIWKK